VNNQLKERPMATTKHNSTDPVAAARVTADTHGLNTSHLITAHNGAAHVFVADVNDLRPWLNELGGHITRQPAGTDTEKWTFRTHTDFRSDGSSTPILMHALALTGQTVHPDLLAAVV
jgi:hypothetical protein